MSRSTRYYSGENKQRNEIEWFFDHIYYFDTNFSQGQAQNVRNPPNLDENDGFTFSYTHPLEKSQRLLFNQIKLIVDNAIRRNSYILICSFMISNFEVIKLIEKALEKLRGKIYILVGDKRNLFVTYNKKYDSINKGLSTLANSGAIVRYMQNAHLKFISNGKESLICTSNFTTEGLFKNPEFGVLLQKTSIGKQLNRLFYYLWFVKSEQILVNGNWIKVPKNESSNLMNKKNEFSNPEIILSSKTKINEINQKFKVLVNESLYEILIKEMESAKKSIDLSVYLFTTTSNPKLERIDKILMKKAKENVEIRILVPSIRTKFIRSMQRTLKRFSQSGIHVKFYRELHGKCLIIDEKRVLIFTANIDKYLVDEKSCDIGYVVSNQVAVKNFRSFFEHLWRESAYNFDINTPINLHADLVIKSYKLISYKPSISVLMLKNLIENSKSINFLYHSTGSLLQINGNNGKVLNLYIELKDQQSFEIREEVILLFGMINNKPKMNLKDSIAYSVKNLSLNLLWEK